MDDKEKSFNNKNMSKTMIKSQRKLTLMSLLVCFLLVVALITITACNESKENKDSEIKVNITDEPSLTKEAKLLEQFADYNENSKLVKISVRDYGDILIKLFPEYAPKAVERFLELVEDKYYDGLSFSKVIDNYLVQTDLNSSYDSYDYFEDEFNSKLHPYRGAICFANMGKKDTNSTQFMIIQTKAEYIDRLQELVDYKGYSLPNYLHDAYGANLDARQLNSYMIYGGAPWLYGHHTVFGQMYEGFDVLDNITKVKINNDYKPQEDIIIDKITIIQ